MSVSLIESELKRFLARDTPGVICIKGKWGTGKTYSWNKWLNSACKEKSLSLETYSYVSLFGINSLDELKSAIFENTLPTESLDAKPSVETFGINAAGVAQSWRKGVKVLSTLPKAKEFAALLQSGAFLSVRQRIICIDDLERKGKNLAMKDVLGLVSWLAEQRGCKIILILNDGMLEEADGNDLKKLNEKVIDKTLDFAPPSEECISVALGGSEIWNEDLTRGVRILGLSNIRIIRKMADACERVWPLLKEFDAQVGKQAATAIAVSGWSIYDPESAPPFEFLMHKRPSQAMGFDKEKFTEDEVRWNGILDEIGFTNFDEFDLALYQGMTQGYFNDELIVEQGNALNARIDQGQTNEAYHAAWRLFHDSLEDNQAKVTEELYRTFCENAKNVDPLNASGTVRVLKQLGAEGDAQNAILHYMKERDGEPIAFFDLDGSAFGNEVQDEDLRTAFATKLGSFSEGRSAKEILKKIGLENDWSRSDLLVLSKLTADEFGRLFQECSGPNLRKILRTVLSFKQTEGEVSVGATISETARAALVELAKGSEINRIRLKRYGIEVEEPE